MTMSCIWIDFRSNRLMDEAFIRVERQMRALHFLGVPFAWTMHCGFEMAFVRPPISV